MDSVFIENLRLDCLIGVTDEERRLPQRVILDMRLVRDLRGAAASEKIDETVDYREVRRQVSELVSNGKFKLLESLAEGVASLAMSKFDVDRVVVKVRKEKYSVEPSIGIEIERERGKKKKRGGLAPR